MLETWWIIIFIYTLFYFNTSVLIEIQFDFILAQMSPQFLAFFYNGGMVSSLQV